MSKNYFSKIINNCTFIFIFYLFNMLGKINIYTFLEVFNKYVWISNMCTERKKKDKKGLKCVFK